MRKFIIALVVALTMIGAVSTVAAVTASPAQALVVSTSPVDTGGGGQYCWYYGKNEFRWGYPAGWYCLVWPCLCDWYYFGGGQANLTVAKPE